MVLGMTGRIPHAWCWLAALILPLAAMSGANIPQGYTAERYASMWQRSPFTLSSVVEAPQAGFAEQLTLASIMQIGDKPYVTILNKQTQKRFTVAPGSPADGIEVVSVTNPTSPKEAVVQLKKGAESGSVKFDLTLLRATAAVPQPGQPQPPQTPGQPAMPQPPQVNNPGIPPGAGARTPTPNTGRRRIIIPSQPPPPAAQPPK